MKHIIQKIFVLGLILATGVVLAAEHEVKMLNVGKDGATMVFDPGYLKVEPGDTVKFVSVDAGHNSESFFTPEGSATWKGEISKDVTVTLDKEGIYLYKCMPHTVMAMVGVVQVGEAKNKDAAVGAAKDFAKQFALNKDRFDKYMAEVK